MLNFSKEMSEIVPYWNRFSGGHDQISGYIVLPCRVILAMGEEEVTNNIWQLIVVGRIGRMGWRDCWDTKGIKFEPKAYSSSPPPKCGSESVPQQPITGLEWKLQLQNTNIRTSLSPENNNGNVQDNLMLQQLGCIVFQVFSQLLINWTANTCQFLCLKVEFQVPQLLSNLAILFAFLFSSFWQYAKLEVRQISAIGGCVIVTASPHRCLVTWPRGGACWISLCLLCIVPHWRLVHLSRHQPLKSFLTTAGGSRHPTRGKK